MVIYIGVGVLGDLSVHIRLFHVPPEGRCGWGDPRDLFSCFPPLRARGGGDGGLQATLCYSDSCVENLSCKMFNVGEKRSPHVQESLSSSGAFLR